MPELPEVETVVRDLRDAVAGRTITRVDVLHGGVIRFPLPEAFAAGLQGARVEVVSRIGKFIFCALDTGDELVVHLGMTGHLLVTDAGAPRPPHTHLRAWLDDGRELRYDDARRFGRLLLGSRETLRAARVLPSLGVDPLTSGFTAAHLDAYLRRTTRMLKAALLDQGGVAGLGNIYVDEVCHLAGVRPTRRCHRLTRRERQAIYDAIPVILHKAIAHRGSSVDDYRDVWNAQGSMQEQLQVYGRGWQPCFRCGTVLARTVVGGRTTVYCPKCQR
ncbi:MAG TPA: bifunctional DNA-formamidopyrimidine glycosylase/DNA-(apurinic or apyrimidinic site) lyase [Candidatus Dormibacteraeota bacterium]|nr:bifunctional DNA-formamidopyrimidine glycosylase/DNA-(apurinic or apyrimidinic site) lyase [Candidatus Dormibacteraeota bacterium]